MRLFISVLLLSGTVATAAPFDSLFRQKNAAGTGNTEYPVADPGANHFLKWDNATNKIVFDAGGVGSGTVTSVGWTGGIVSIATATTTPAFTIAGTSGGIPYFNSGTTWATSAALAANALVLGGGAGAAPASTTTGTGVVTALGVNVGTAGAFVVNGGAGGTPSSLTGTNITGTASGLTAGNVTTNANLTGHVTSVGNAAVLGSFTLAQLSTATSDANIARIDAGQTFTGIQVFTSPDVTTSITTPSTTLAVFNTTATTINAFGATTALNVGASAATIFNFGGHTASAEQRFLEPSGSGTNYTGFKNAAQTFSITHTWPTTAPTDGQVLSSLASGVMSWVTPGAMDFDTLSAAVEGDLDGDDVLAVSHDGTEKKIQLTDFEEWIESLSLTFSVINVTDLNVTNLVLPNGAAPTTDATGEVALDTTITDHKSLIQYDGGADEMLVIAIPRANLDNTDGDVIKYDAATDAFVMAPDSTGAGSLGANLSSTTNDITSDNEAIVLAGTAESITSTFSSNTLTITSTTGVAIINFPDASIPAADLEATVTRDVEWDTVGEVETIWSANILLETEIDASSELRALMDDESGTGALLFADGNIGAGTAATPAAADDDTSIATTAYVQDEVDSTLTGSHTTPSTTDPLSPTWTGPTHVVFYGATGEINLPAAAGYTGRGIIVYNTGAFTISLDPDGSEVIVRDGTVQTGGVTMTLSTGAGNYVALLSDGVRWITLGFKGTLGAGA